MTDTPIAALGNLTLIVRDRDGDGEFDAAVGETPADAFGLATSDGRVNFSETRVRSALREAGIGELRPGARLQRIGAYMDMVREADRIMTGEGDYARAARELERAQAYAEEQGIGIDAARFGDLRWRLVYLAYARGAEGLSELKNEDLSVLDGDLDPQSRQASARLVLEYTGTWAEIRRIEADSSMTCESRYTRARELRSEIGARARRLREIGDTVERVFPIVPRELPAERPPFQPPSPTERMLNHVRGALRRWWEEL